MQTVSFDVGEREWVPNRPLVMTATIDIPTVTVALGLGGYDEKTEAPTTWVTAPNAAVQTDKPSTKSVEGQMFLGDTIRPAAGDWWVYMRVTLPSGEEVVGRYRYERVRIVNSGIVNYP